jgi:hypothetical protein
MRVRAHFLAAVVFVSSASALAAKPASFEKQYKAAVKLENSGDLTGALAAFEAIPAESRDYNAKLHIASCKKKLGRLLEAAKDYDAIRTDPKADSATVDTAASDLEDVRGRTPKIRLRLTAATTGVVVTVDGAEVTAPTEHLVNPGEHAVIAKRGEAVVYERRLTLPESAAVEVEIDAPVAPKANAAPPVVTAPEAPPPSSSGAGRAVPFYIAGGVLGVGAVVSFVLASSAKSSVADNCAAQHSLTCNLDDAGGSRVRTWETIGWVSGGLAVAAIGVGIVIHSRGSSTTSSSAAVRPTIGVMNGLVLEGRF